MERYNKQFGIVSKDILTDPELSMQAKAVYAILCTYCNQRKNLFSFY